MIDIRPVGYIIGWLVLLLGALMLPPLLLDLLDGDQQRPGLRALARC